ncbi:MAG: AMP-binding protein [Candidatus Atabeyarchaeum deiterrae]
MSDLSNGGHPINIGMILSRHAQYRPNHPAVVFKEKRLNYLQLNQEVNRISNALLGMGIKKGDKVATLLPNCVELLETYWAAAKTGAVVVPLSPMLLPKGLKSLLDDSESRAIITSSSLAKNVEEVRHELTRIIDDGYIVVDSSVMPHYQYYHEMKARASDQDPQGIEINENDPYNIIYSSGTTGLPKGITHTHYIRLMYALTMIPVFRMTPESVMMHSGSIVFNATFVTLMPALYMGCTFVLLPAFNPEDFIETVSKEKVTHMMIVPAQVIAILRSPKFSLKALQSIEMICNVGAPLLKEHKQELNKRLPGRYYELYGLTEGFVTVLDKYDYSRKPNSVGTPGPLYQMRIVDENDNDVPTGQTGEIIGRGPVLMPRYYKRPDQTEQAIKDGWLYTGDMGYIDDDGFLYLVDRKKDMIDSGGVKVYPRDIEEVVARHPEVREAAVFGIPDEKWGETPVAAVVLNRPGSITAESLLKWINENVGAKYQRVSKVIVSEELPRNIAGKILKRVMREEYLVKK